MTDKEKEKMKTQEHWGLFDTLEKMYKDDFKQNYKEFKAHMLYILDTMDHMYKKEN